MTLDGLEYCAPFPFAVAPVDTPLDYLHGPLGDFSSASLTVGDHMVRAVPFAGPDCTGQIGNPHSHYLKVECTSCPGYVASLSLWNPFWKIAEVENDDVICRSSLWWFGRAEIRAETASCSRQDGITEVKFDFGWSDKSTYSTVAKSEPFVHPKPWNLFGMTWWCGVSLTVGRRYRVTATPFSDHRATRVMGMPYYMEFEIGDC